MNGRFLIAFCAVIGTTANAQQATSWQASISATANAQRYFPTGTPLALTTRTQISTKDMKPGDRVYFTVAESLSYRGQIVVPVGTSAVGEVAWADRNGFFGKKGKLGVKLLFLDTAFGHVALDGEASKNGKSGTLASAATIAFISPLGFLIHGTSATMPYGMPVSAYLAEPLAFVEQASRPAAPGFAVEADAPRQVAVNSVPSLQR